MTAKSFVAALAALFIAGATFAGDWPGWRGPRGDGRSPEKGIPTRWSRSENVRWKVPVPGKGHSSPAIAGERIFLTTCLEEKGERRLLCLERASGRELWGRTVLSSPLEKKHLLNSFASSTPACDGERVFSAFLDTAAGAPRARVYCHDLDGKLLWEVSPGEFHSVHGFCSSPVLYKDKVIVNGDQDAEAWIVALERTSGKELWRIPRPNKTRSYCVPAIFEAGGRIQMVLSGSKCTASYDPETGKPWWILDGPTEQMVASVVLAKDVFFVSGGYPELHILGLPVDRSGRLEPKDVLWRTIEGVSYVPSPLATAERFYVVSDKGIASCFEARSGQRLWRQRLGGRHSASLVEAEGHIYFLSDAGECWVVRDAPEYELVALNRLEEECNASPAIAGAQIFIRTAEHLYAIGARR